MEKRGLTIGTYNTAEQLWTLTGWELSAPEYQENFLNVPGRDGVLDLSAALTNGAPTYHSRTLTVKLECSEGTRLEREAAINTMANWLDGWRLDIVLPDDPGHYITGRVSVAKEYNDNAHAAVTVTAVCDPWRYAKNETVYTLGAREAILADNVTVEKKTNNALPVYWLTYAEIQGHSTALVIFDGVIYECPVTFFPAEGVDAAGFYLGNFAGNAPEYPFSFIGYDGQNFSLLGVADGTHTVSFSAVEVTGLTSTEQTVHLANAGRRTAVPLLAIHDGTVLLKYGAYSWALGAGTYQLPDLTLPQGGGALTYSGTGWARITYREAVL